MARTTVDDCIKKCPNHFELVVGAVSRAKKLRLGEHSELEDSGNDRPVVQALREVAKGLHKIDLEGELVSDIQATTSLASLPTMSDSASESTQPESDQPAEPANN